VSVNAVAIVNPRAGVGNRLAIEAVRAMGEHWHKMDIRLTERHGHARELAEQAVREGREIVIASGGDGTVNEVGWGLLGSTVKLGLVPAGSGNGLGRMLGIPRNPLRALSLLATAVTRRMDVGMINDKPFFNVAGAGFDAAVGKAFDDHGRSGGRRGMFTYFKVGLHTAWGYRSEEFVLDLGQPGPLRRLLLVGFANGRQYGGGALIAPRARLDDGQLDVVCIEDAPVAEVLWNAPKMYLGRIDAFRRYERTLAESAVLTGAGPIAFHRDGEPEPPAERLEVKVLPRAINMLVPLATARAANGPFAAEG
jgi:diacylglycerol kinase (ATP)